MKKLLAFITQAVESVIAFFQRAITRVPQLSAHLAQTQRKEFSVEVVRPDDLLILTLDFYNLHIKSTGGVPQLERVGPGNGFMVARFQPQNIVEQAFFEKDDGAPNPPDPPSLPTLDDPLLPPPVASRIAGPSQLVFRINDTQLPIDFKLEKLLQVLQDSEPIVQPRILKPRPIPDVGGLTDFGGQRSQYSAIEAPIRLIISPDAQSRWLHKQAPAKSKDLKHTELWHTRLDGQKKTVSAVWSPDYNINNVDPAPDDQHPFRMSLNAENRHQLVLLTSDPELIGAEPAAVEQLLLSSQGAWMSLHGKWDTKLPLIEWRHRMTAGRDQYVRVVKEGNLFWGGHRAVFIKITERKVQMVKAGALEGKPAAYLRQRYIVVVKQPTRTYSHRHFPFRSVTIKTLVTPNLDLPETDDIFGNKENAFWPRVNTHDFQFHVVATDWEGHEIEFLTPMAFIVKTISNVSSSMDPIIAEYNKHKVKKEQWQQDMGGQMIAFAPSIKTGDTTLETQSMKFYAMPGSGSPRFLPMMCTADVNIPAVRQISGNQSHSTIKLDETYTLASGIHFGNKAEVFAQVVGPQTPVNFSADKTGGLVAPNFNIAGLSRYFGPVGANYITQFAAGSFSPAEVFQGVKLLGGIELGSIISPVINATPDAAGTKIPQLQTIRTEVAGKQVFQTQYLWDVPHDFLVDAGPFKRNPASQFFIKTTVNTPLDGTPPSFEIQGGLKNFIVTLIPKAELELVALHFTSVDFIARPNQKVDFGIIFNKFEFLGDLAFVNKLSEVIPMDGFDDPPFLDLVPPPDAGVRVGFTQGIPTVGIGIFTLQNISFGANFFLPFIDKPANLRLNFCERHQPFILTVTLFGGGGFFAIDIGFKGVQQIEAALEFGAAIALNLGVASGAAVIMGGVYYRGTGADFEFSAYFRAAGALCVLGIITVSVELYIALNYASKKSDPHGGMLWGQASITVKIKIAFFSTSVSVGIEREFAGSDPKFSETVSPANWLDYCESFADYPA